MSDKFIPSSRVANNKPNEMWKTPVRSVICSLRCQGHSYDEIKKLAGLEQSTIQSIINGPTSRTTRKGKAFKPQLLTPKEVRRIFLFVSESWVNRTKSWARIK